MHDPSWQIFWAIWKWLFFFSFGFIVPGLAAIAVCYLSSEWICFLPKLNKLVQARVIEIKARKKISKEERVKLNEEEQLLRAAESDRHR